MMENRTLIFCTECNGLGHIPKTAVGMQSLSELNRRLVCGKCMGTGRLWKVTQIRFEPYKPLAPKELEKETN